MTGHQCVWWHPGIVAKFLAAAQMARKHDGAWAWIVADHDTSDPWSLEIPVQHEGAIASTTVRWAEAPERGLVARDLRPIDPATFDNARVEPRSARDGVLRAHAALRQHRDADDGVTQWYRALASTLQPILALPSPIRASRLLSTGVGRRWVDRMSGDPETCAIAYNRACAAYPGAGVRNLHVGVDPGAIELPLWHSAPAQARGRVFAGDLDRYAPADLLPRALTLTAFVRRYLCDLFVHGTGGHRYDRVADDWCARWEAGPLAPDAMISADMHLDLEVDRIDDGELERAIWAHQHAYHNPALERYGSDAARKTDALREMQGMARGSAERRRAFRAMHEGLEAYRTRAAGTLRAQREEIERLTRAIESRPIARSRAWAMVLHDPSALERLDRDVGAALG